MNTALTIAAHFDNDGQRFTDNDGQSIRAFCIEQADDVTRLDSGAVFTFADGSALALTDGGWDVVVPYLTGWASADASGQPDPTAWTFGVAE